MNTPLAILREAVSFDFPRVPNAPKLRAYFLGRDSVPCVLDNYFCNGVKSRLPDESDRDAVSLSVYAVPDEFYNCLRRIRLPSDLTYVIVARFQHKFLHDDKVSASEARSQGSRSGESWRSNRELLL